MGASRAAVDAGYALNDWQVGQTGKVVAPAAGDAMLRAWKMASTDIPCLCIEKQYLSGCWPISDIEVYTLFMVQKCNITKIRADKASQPRCEDRQELRFALKFASSFAFGDVFMLRRLLLTTACAVASVSAAFAADLPTKAPAYRAPIAPSYTWTGFYLGAHVGWGWEHHTSTNVGTINSVNFPAGTTDSADMNGVLGGIQGGYDWQFAPNWLVGVGGDFSWSGIKGDANNPSLITPAVVSHVHDEYRWLATLTGRLGYLPSSNWLLYAKGGAAWGDQKTSSFTTNAVGATVTTVTGGQTRTGWTAGAGTEYRFAPNWSALLEYDYIDFGTVTTSNTVTFSTAAPPILTGVTLLRDRKSQVNVVKLGVNYRF